MAQNYAALVRNTQGDAGQINVDGSNIKIRAGGDGKTGGKNEAMMLDGKGNLDAKKASLEIVAGDGEDKAIMDFAALLKVKKEVLPNLSWDEVKALVRELKDPFGVLCEDDLLEAEFDDQENKIKSIKGVQLKKFLKYVEGLKEQGKKGQPPQYQK